LGEGAVRPVGVVMIHVDREGHARVDGG
jgi:hypothetical protein